jgi:hypothetical protein
LGLAGRVTLTELGRPGADRDVPPPWWRRWLREPAALPAVWIIDGLDEGVDLNDRLLDAVLVHLEGLTQQHLESLRLVLLSRPHQGLAGFRGRLGSLYPRYTERVLREFTLARVDRDTAEALVGHAAFPRVLETIRRNGLQSLAGFPVVLGFLNRHPEASRLTPVEVWRGVLNELMGQSQRDRVRPFQTEPEERFDAACRAAAVLTLTRRETIREYSPDPDEPTLGSLFGLEPGSNRQRLAARETFRTAAFQALPEEGTYRFSERNVQDWLTAFALANLPRVALATAMSDASGRLHLRLRETARLIRVINPDPGIQADLDRMTGEVDLPSDAVEPSLAQSLTCLDRLEKLARESDWGLRLNGEVGDALGRLGVPGLESELVRRLSDPTRPPQVKLLLIDVAEATRAADAVDTAGRLVLDPGEDERVREEALHFVCRLGGNDQLRDLEIPVAEGQGSSDIEGRLRGILIYELLNRRLWPVWRAARHAPAAARHVIDHRTVLLHALEERLTVEDARRLLPYFLEISGRQADERDQGVPGVLERAIGLVLGQGSLSPGDTTLLVRLALDMLGDDRYRADALGISQRLRSIPEARRTFYRYDAERLLRGESSTTVGRRAIVPGDWEWLRRQARGEWASLPYVWTDVFLLGEAAMGEVRLSGPDWDDLVVEIGERAPGLPARIEEERRRFDEEERRWRSELEERQTNMPEERSLEDVVRAILTRRGRPEADRMRELGYICFYPQVRPYNITGGWDELPEALKEQVLDACRAGLGSGQPSPLPEGDTVNGLTLGEAASFEHLATSEGAHLWLTFELIGRWLPVALHAPMSRGWTDLIRACWSVSREATERAVAETIVAVSGRFERPSQLRMIPSECWTGVLSETVHELVVDEARPPATRRELLDVLAARDLDLALPTAEHLSRLPITESPEDELRQAGRNVVLCRDPDAIFEMIEREFGERGGSCLEELYALSRDRGEPRADWHRWPVSRQARLAALLVRACPWTGELCGAQSRWGTDLRTTRDMVLESLLTGNSNEHAEALERLAGFDPHLRHVILTRRASSAAVDVLREGARGSLHDPSALPLQTARQLLDQRDFRLIRSNEDLLESVLFALELVRGEVGLDLPLLYGAPTRKGGSKDDQQAGSEAGREHLEEDALQAYLRRRLKDLLTRVTEGVDVQIGREDQVSYRGRLDLRITAPCLRSRRLATVVVEVKWSTNPETKSALDDQLGRRYLLGEGLTHGVFLVGWSGWWQPGQGQPRGRSPNELARYLREQRDSFCCVGAPGEGLRIEPVVLDLSWQPPEAASGTGRPTN